eukprot:scaffold114969_cov57-Phaeocystis_antarctica.AAC.1
MASGPPPPPPPSPPPSPVGRPAWRCRATSRRRARADLTHATQRSRPPSSADSSTGFGCIVSDVPPRSSSAVNGGAPLSARQRRS